MPADAEAPDPPAPYFENTGTASAAAHASGIVAAFLSVRREALGDPLTVKETFRRTAVDLRRNPDYQGRGLINLLHALQGAVDVGQSTSPLGLSASRASETSPAQQRVPIMAAPDGGAPSAAAITVQPRRAVSLFCSYSHADIKLRQQFERSIVQLLQDRRIDVWHDGEIVPGDKWRAEIDRQLASSQMIVLLVSPDFMQSTFIQKVELTQALERHEAGKARVIPIVLRPIVSLGPLASLEALPRKARALTTWKNRDSAWVDVAQGVERALNALVGH
jgi:hypothetical protein